MEQDTEAHVASESGAGAPGELPRHAAHASQSALEDALAEFLPGFRVLDRGLVLGGVELGGAPQRTVDLVCAVRPGRVVLVLLVDGARDEAWLAALDAMAYARTHAEALARHVRLDRADLDPLVVLIAERFSTRVRSGLGALPPSHLKLFELREISTEGAKRQYLNPVGFGVSADRARERSPEEFVSALPEPSRALAESVLARLPRIDEDLDLLVVDDAVHWRIRGVELGTLWRQGERLTGAIAPTDERVDLASGAQVETFLGRVLDAHRDAFSAEPFADRTERDPAARASAFSEPLLTQEEIDAFRN